MKRQSIVWLSATVAVLGAAACFSAPTGTKAGSPSRVVISELKAPGGHTQLAVGSLTYANLNKNDTMIVGVQVLDNVGNYQSFALPTYATASAAVAALNPYPDSIVGVVPGNTLYKALLIGVATGTTTVTIQAAGLSDSVVVKVN